MIFFTGCAQPEDKLLGTWATVSNGQTVYFSFLKNNELNVNNEIFMNYFVTGDNKLVLGREAPASFSIKGDTLQINQEDYVHVMTFKRLK
ncbi:MAG: hypothetical protein LBS97_02780 [Treponema sp.]|jgi:hypothetical protein|nr:hypothetical protein [Treponema sp.]